MPGRALAKQRSIASMQDIAPWLNTYEEKDDSRAVEAMKKACGAMAEAQKAVNDLQLTTGDCVEALKVAAESYRGAEKKWQALPLCAGEKLQVKAETVSYTHLTLPTKRIV